MSLMTFLDAVLIILLILMFANVLYYAAKAPKEASQEDKDAEVSQSTSDNTKSDKSC